MKEIVTTKLVEQTTRKWVADDGTEFCNELDCRTHEYSKRVHDWEIKFEMLKPILLNPPFLHQYDIGHEAWLIKLKNEEDFYTLYFYLKAKHCEFSNDHTNKFPQNVILQSNGDEYCWMYSVEELNPQFEKFEKEIELIKKAIKENENE